MVAHVIDNVIERHNDRINGIDPHHGIESINNMAKQYVIKTTAGTAINMQLGESITGGFWKWVNDEPKEFTVTAPISKGSVFTKSGITTAPDIMSVTDLKDGKPKRLLVGAVLLKALTENFPNDGYVGRSFRCVQGPPPDGVRYKSMDIKELIPAGPDDESPEPSEEKKTKKK